MVARRASIVPKGGEAVEGQARIPHRMDQRAHLNRNLRFLHFTPP
jgi:hypothetical protein